MSWRVGIDIGGTFTDLVALADDGRLVRHKVSSTPRAPESGLLAALALLLADIQPQDIGIVAHASTIATNALLGQMHLELPRVAFVTTEGFRDVLEIGRQNRSAIYDLNVTRPRPLARRADRLVVRERLTADGSVLVALDPASVERAVATIAERGIRSVAIGLLHADVDGVHERTIADALRAAIPEADVSLSSEIDPQYREYERFSTTVVNAALAPIVRAYLDRVARGVREAGVAAPIFVMRSDGGMTLLERASGRPATLIESGPASGVIGAAYLGRALGIDNVLSFDMGGTTAKAGTIFGGVPEVSVGVRSCRRNAQRAHDQGQRLSGALSVRRFSRSECRRRHHRLDRCGGRAARRPAVGRCRSGAGLLRQRRAADGHRCKRRAGPARIRARCSAARFRSTRRARMTRSPRWRRPLDGDVERTAAGIVALVDAEMAKVLRIVSVERGHDPRDFTLLAFGGGGPLHACAVARDVGIARIIVPASPGVFSAYGLLAADVRVTVVRSLVGAGRRVDVGEGRRARMRRWPPKAKPRSTSKASRPTGAASCANSICVTSDSRPN